MGSRCVKATVAAITCRPYGAPPAGSGARHISSSARNTVPPIISPHSEMYCRPCRAVCGQMRRVEHVRQTSTGSTHVATRPVIQPAWSSAPSECAASAHSSACAVASMSIAREAGPRTSLFSFRMNSSSIATSLNRSETGSISLRASSTAWSHTFSGRRFCFRWRPSLRPDPPRPGVCEPVRAWSSLLSLPLSAPSPPPPPPCCRCCCLATLCTAARTIASPSSSESLV
mmetsp:Transcript_4040/g.12967  ORF Transcript_4040/g.12967 Transcript_4040/m.12967 type:complete len:229 (+) Transcript_4040:942-1628(+)